MPPRKQLRAEASLGRAGKAAENPPRSTGQPAWANTEDLARCLKGGMGFVVTLAEHYPGTAWHAFLNASVEQFFGFDDPFTADWWGGIWGNQTVAYRSTQTGANVSAQMGMDG